MFRMVLIVLWKVLVVGFRRLFVGPLHRSWPYRFEVFVEVTRTVIALNARGMAKGTPFPPIPAAPLSPSVRRDVKIERGELVGCPSLTFTPDGWTPAASTILYLHGGGYIVCSPWTHREMIGQIARLSGARCVALDYRKAPLHPFPAAIDDSERAYQALLAEGVPPERLFIAGDSAGGGLCLALLQRNREAGRAQPRGVALLSPWCNLHSDAESIRHNATFDYLPAAHLRSVADLYLGTDCKADHPLASALHADLSGLPPLLVLSGELEVFRDDIEQFARSAEQAGTQVRLLRGEAMIHVWPVFAAWFPSCRPALQAIGDFVRELSDAAEPSGVAVVHEQRA
jgi:monoterpene epsilon-lactone hydrolase